MLLEFEFKNFRSFKEDALLSMLPVNAYKELPENLAAITPQGTKSSGVLSAVVIYGANASGKTNLLRAVDYARGMALGAIPFNRDAHLCSFVGNDSPTSFRFSFITNDIRYDYGFAFDSRGAISEELSSHPKDKGARLVFSRIRNSDGTYIVKQGSYQQGITSKLKGLDDNGLVLRLLALFGNVDCNAVMDWLNNGISVLDRSTNLDYGQLLAKLRDLGEDNFKKAILAISSADLGITGAQISESELTEQEMESQKRAADKMAELYEAITGQKIDAPQSIDRKITFQFTHHIDGSDVGFGFDDESLGTVAMLSLAADFLDALSTGKTLFVDEAERSLHPLLLRSLVTLFFDRKLNSKNAQLVFTSHDLSFLDSGVLRRDQIWFVDKDVKNGSSELYPLSSYSPRKDDSILNRYLYGAYGAVPFVEGAIVHA